MPARKHSRYPGVTMRLLDSRWVARGFKDAKHHHLGVFDDEITAAMCSYTWRRRNDVPNAFEPELLDTLFAVNGPVEPVGRRSYKKPVVTPPQEEVTP